MKLLVSWLNYIWGVRVSIIASHDLALKFNKHRIVFNAGDPLIYPLNSYTSIHTWQHVMHYYHGYTRTHKLIKFSKLGKEQHLDHQRSSLPTSHPLVQTLPTSIGRRVYNNVFWTCNFPIYTSLTCLRRKRIFGTLLVCLPMRGLKYTNHVLRLWYNRDGKFMCASL